MGFLINEQEVFLELSYLQKCKQILNEEFLIKKKRNPRFFLHSFGCQGNLSESEKIKGMLTQMGYVPTTNFKNADFAIFNTCAVRESAQNRVIGNLGILVHIKEQLNKDMIIAVCGCMVQQNSVAQKIKKMFPTINLIFGTHVLHKFARMVFEVLSSKKKLCLVENSNGVIAEGLPIKRDSGLKAFVPISYGCNNFCTYCIVPHIKGRERSRSFEAIVSEVQNLVKLGYKEFTLLGQNVNSYGFDFKENCVDFSKLLVALNKIEGSFRIRFLTSHPKNLTKNLIDTISKCEKVCHHIHLPVQSGSNKILKKMNRNYEIETYLNLVDYAKNKLSGLTISTDIIVGFPGETYSDFKQTLKLIETVRFSSVFSFIFSKREGTEAAKMDDFIPRHEKAKWLNELINCQNKISDEINRSFVGKIEQVLFENKLKNDENTIFGRTDSNLIVRCENDNLSLNKFKQVKIIDSCRTFLLGKIICDGWNKLRWWRLIEHNWRNF